MLIHNITEAIGTTPLLEVAPSVHGLERVRLFAKLEHLNPWGAVKDRTAWNMLKDELTRIKETGQTVIESTSGRTGIAIQVLCAMHGISFELVTNRIHVPETMELLRLLGADILEMPGLSSCPDPSDPHNPLAFIEQRMSTREGEYVHPSQYTNPLNTQAHYETTGPEIFADAGAMDFLFVALGTSGSSRGVGQYLKEKNRNLRVIGVVARTGEILPGMRNANELHEVGLFDLAVYDKIVEISQNDALDAMLQLNRQCGVLCGPTSGATFAAATQYLASIDPPAQPLEEESKLKACFIVADRVELYLSFLKKVRPALFQLPATKGLLDEMNPEEDGPSVSVEEAEKWLADPDLLVVDMRGSITFKAGHLPHSINLGPSVITDLCRRGLIFSRSHHILFVCPTGVQSGRFAAALTARGFNCASLQHGFLAWSHANKPIVTVQQPMSS